MLPFAWPMARVPNWTRDSESERLLPLIDGSGEGGKAKAVIADGQWSTNLHL